MKQNYEGDWSVIPLRGPAGTEHPVMMIYSDPTCCDFTDTAYLDKCSYLKDVLEQFKSKLQAVRLMKLAAGSIIKEHRDYDLSFANGVVRLHIPIRTNSGVEFYLNNERILMREGECWYLRLSEPHRVINAGKSDRVHLVIDAEVDEWMRNILSIDETSLF